MTDDDVNDPKSVLRRYLQQARDTMVWKLDELGEYDVRRPMTPTGTNLLGLVKHLAAIEIGYFGNTFGRPYPDAPAWVYDESGDNSDMWATETQSRAEIVGLYHSAWAHADATITELALDVTGEVPWWPADKRTVTLQRILVHVATETNRHAGHADIVRELIDGAAGLRAANDNLAFTDQDQWSTYRAKLEQVARTVADGHDQVKN